jgi:hypothetical protein
MDYTLENAADLAIAVLWSCATSEENRFAVGVPGDSIYNNYYAGAHSGAFNAVATWLLAEAGVTHGYSRALTQEVKEATLLMAEDILDVMADCGPEPVRSLRRIVIEQRER